MPLLRIWKRNFAINGDHDDSIVHPNCPFSSNFDLLFSVFSVSRKICHSVKASASHALSILDMIRTSPHTNLLYTFFDITKRCINYRFWESFSTHKTAWSFLTTYSRPCTMAFGVKIWPRKSGVFWPQESGVRCIVDYTWSKMTTRFQIVYKQLPIL